MNTGQTPVVVFIAGSGRSGSTLVERALGQIEGYVNVGETVELFRSVLTKSLAGKTVLCGCGEPIEACPFWTAVAERAFGGWSPELVQRATSLQRSVAAQRHIPNLMLGGRAPEGFRRDLASFADIYGRLYRAVQAESGARVVVDASKWPGQGLALSRDRDLDVRVLHLVRDVRGVADSWTKSGVARPASGERREVMTTDHAWRTAARWSLFQLEVRALGMELEHSSLLRYEDFVRDPSQALRTTLGDLGLASDRDSGLSHIQGSCLLLEPSHGLAGNPVRFTHGEVRLREDEAWRNRISRGRQMALASVGLPGLAACGYIPAPTTR